MSDDTDSEEKQLQFHQMELDDRILKAIALLGWMRPTLKRRQREKEVVKLDSLETIVIDEADLVFSFGFKDDLEKVLTKLPSIYQAILASATLSADVTELKRLVLHNPVVLKLEEPELAPVTQLTHYRILAEESDKAAILYSLLKLELIRGKSIIFVNTVDRCYK